MKRTDGLTLAEVVISLAVVVLLAFLLLPTVARKREEARRTRCMSNLNQLAKAMATYLNQLGDDRFYPWPAGRPGCGGPGQAADFGGAEWLATLYWTPILADGELFICPSTTDWNEHGRDLGRDGCSGPGFQGGPDGKLKPDAVSYAGMGHTSVAVYQREKLGRPPATNSPVMHDFPPGEPVACDDTEGSINHGGRYGGMNVLFSDSHMEFWTTEKIDIERGVGMRGTPLAWLRN
jgi:type II secretory pathway pseudopilin PulG